MASRAEVDDSWQENVDTAMVEFFEQRLGPDIAGDAKRYCPKRTGDLAESVEHHVEDGNLIVSATGSDEQSYAYYVEMGTRPHVIRPNGKQALFWAGAAHPVKKVNHPGTKPEPFLRPALFQERGE